MRVISFLVYKSAKGVGANLMFQFGGTYLKLMSMFGVYITKQSVFLLAPMMVNDVRKYFTKQIWQNKFILFKQHGIN